MSLRGLRLGRSQVLNGVALHGGAFLRFSPLCATAMHCRPERLQRKFRALIQFSLEPVGRTVTYGGGAGKFAPCGPTPKAEPRKRRAPVQGTGQIHTTHSKRHAFSAGCSVFLLAVSEHLDATVRSPPAWTGEFHFQAFHLSAQCMLRPLLHWYCTDIALLLRL